MTRQKHLKQLIRARMEKQRQRILSIEQIAQPDDLGRLVEGGLRRCYQDLQQPSLTMAPNNARLDALRSWGERLHGRDDKQSWQRCFQPGANLWRGLGAIYSFIEHYGTGGGLCRPLFADFLSEAGLALARPDLTALSEQYAALGRGWSELADAALPDSIPELRQNKTLHARMAELMHEGAPAEEVRAIWQQLEALEQQASERFPLSEAGCDELRAGLKTRVLALRRAEVAAHEAMITLMGK